MKANPVPVKASEFSRFSFRNTVKRHAIIKKKMTETTSL